MRSTRDDYRRQRLAGRPGQAGSRPGSQDISGRTLVALLLSLLVAACQPVGRLVGEGSLFRSLPGGEFILHRDITIKAGLAHTSFQDGAMASGYNEFYPHCELQVAKISEEPQTIPAGTYRIGRVLGITRYVTRPKAGIMLAAAGDFYLPVDDSSSEWYMFAYHMPLHSPTAPDGLTLVCGGAYNYPFYVKYPSLQEMQWSLGPYGTINPP